MKRLFFCYTFLFLIAFSTLPSIVHDNSSVFSGTEYLDNTTTTPSGSVGSSGGNYSSGNSSDNNSSSSTSYPSVSMESLESGSSSSNTNEIRIGTSSWESSNNNNDSSSKVSSAVQADNNNASSDDVWFNSLYKEGQANDQSSYVYNGPIVRQKKREHIPNPLEYSDTERQQKRGAWVEQEKEYQERILSGNETLEIIQQMIEEDPSIHSMFTGIALDGKRECKKTLKESADNKSIELAQLGLAYVEDAFEYYEDIDWRSLDYITYRITAIEKTLRSNWSNLGESYDLSLASKFCLEKFGLGYSNFTTCFGSDIQRQQHKELIVILKHTSKLHDAFAANFHISSVTSVIVYAIEHARICNEAQLFRKGFALSDFANRMLDVGRSFAHMAVQGFDVTLEITKSASKGVLQGAENFVESWKDIVTNPINAGILAASLYSPQVAIVIASVALCKVAFTFCNDYKAITQYISEQPQDCITGVFSFATTILLSSKIDGALISQLDKLKSLNTFSKIVKREQVLVTHFAQESKDIKGAIKPLSKMHHEVFKTIKHSTKYDYKAIEYAIRTAKRNPFLIEKGKLSRTMEVLLEFGEELPSPTNWKHLFTGEISNNQLKGFHSARSYPERILEVTKKPDMNGVYWAKYSYKDKTRHSSFFPDSWSRIEILKKMKEAYNNIIKEKKFGRVGITPEGMEIEFWFSKKEVTGKTFINSIFPVYIEK